MSALPRPANETQRLSPDARSVSGVAERLRNQVEKTPSASRLSDAPLDFKSFTRRLQTSSRVQEQTTQPALPHSSDSEFALLLLDEAAKALPILMEEILDLRNKLREVEEKASIDMQEAHGVISEWQHKAESQAEEMELMKGRVEELNQAVDSLNETIQKERGITEESDHKAAQAECLSSLFRERLTASFGEDSAAYAAIQNARERISKTGGG